MENIIAQAARLRRELQYRSFNGDRDIHSDKPGKPDF